MKKSFWILFLLIFFVFLTHDRWLGLALEGRLERTLSGLFGMPVTVTGLRVHLVAGRVRTGRVIFTNQPEFAAGPHLDLQGLDFDFDLWALRQRRVQIRRLLLEEPFYFIDRIATPQGPRNNVVTWYRHLKAQRKEDRLPGREGQVRIETLEIRDGTFIFEDRSGGREAKKKFVFEKLQGTLTGFEWPSPNPSHLSQAVKIHGTFGEHYPAPFGIEGRANFATSKVSFALTGHIEKGLLLEHKRLWEGTSIQITGGTFELRSRTLCLRKQLQSHNDLILKSPKVVPGPSAADKFFGLPMTAAIAFLQNQKTIHLKVPVRGNISDPQFGFHQAFREAFQRSLAQRTRAGISLITDGTSKLATQTASVVQETPSKLAGGLGRIVKRRE